MTRMKKLTGFAMLSLAGAMLSLTAGAQDSSKTFSLSGSVDAYYRYNFNAPPGGTNNHTSFTNSQNSFELGMASLRADGSAMNGKVLATADLGFGRRAEEFSYPDASSFAVGGASINGYNSLAAIKQLYISFYPGKAGSGVKLTIGKWATHVGYEVLDAYANRNYSMDYMFSNGPFSHTGIKAEYAVGTWGFMAGITNPMDNATTTTEVKTAIAQVSTGTKDGKYKVYLNYAGFYGSNELGNPLSLKSFTQLDLVATGTLTKQWSLGLNATSQSRDNGTGANAWYGGALYVNYDPSTPVGLTLRGEYISDSKTVLFPTKSLYDVTLSLDYRVGDFTLIPEIRLDGADTEIFSKSDGTGTKTTVTGLLAAIYKF